MSAPHLPSKNVFLYSKTPLSSHLTLAIRSRGAVRLHLLLHITSRPFICAQIEDISGLECDLVEEEEEEEVEEGCMIALVLK